MLSLLKIRNLALVDELYWQPQAGFLGITGETGAGKSVIMGAIELVLGERADKGMIRSGENQCTLEAVFRLPKLDNINAQLEAAGVPICEEGELIIRRQLTATSNRQFINNTPVTQQLLRQVGAGLVDMHHPDAHRSLSSPERQLDLLDSYAENESLRQSYHGAYRTWLDAKHAYASLQASEMANARELDFLRHQVEEIESAGFSADEVEGLETQWQRARNATRLRESASPMLQMLDGEGMNDGESILSQLRHLVRISQELQRLDESTAPWMEPLNGAVSELEELSSQIEDYLSSMNYDQAAMAQLEERVASLDSLKRKYGADFAAIEQHLTDCRLKLDAIDNREARLEQLAEEEAAHYSELKTIADELSAGRREISPLLEAAFLEHARQLGFLQSHFSLEWHALAEPGPMGAEEVEFLFGPNPGEPLKPLRMIASSGELARVMLALKSALAKQDDTPLLVFDEIDANVGGEIARAVGMKMRELGEHHQVIAITHFPQVAALAEHHYLISKQVEDGRSLSRLVEVQGDARVSELVRMLGANGDAARAHAQGLLL